MILAAAILIWVITTFPVSEDSDNEYEALTNSFAGRMGHFMEPAFRPLGFDWRIAVASLTGFAAKEVTVSTLGILYRVGSDETESGSLREALQRDPHWNPLIAFVLMLFTLIIPPCFAALATIKAELGTKWMAFELLFLFSLGWVTCFIVYQIGSRLTGFGILT